MYINNLGHMTKMATMPIYGKKPSNIFSVTNRLISMKLGMKHPWLKYYNVYINHDPVMTLTKFMARSTWVAHAFEWEKLLKCHLKGKASKSQEIGNGQNIDYSEKRKRPKGFICPCTGLKYHNVQTCLLVYAADSGERLQDHWSSGYIFATKNRNLRVHFNKMVHLHAYEGKCASYQNLVKDLL